MAKRVLVVFGTRPEAIKMAPVVERLRERPDVFDVQVCVTAQHREMLDQVLTLFRIVPEHDLDIMVPRQSLTHVTNRVLEGISLVLEEEQPDAVLVQGDTTTTFAAALAAFYHRIPVGHVEAGLRTDDRYQPYPEEVNRRLTTQLAEWHWAPTSSAAGRLIAEGVEASRVHVTGNTVIDALLETAARPYGFVDKQILAALDTGRRIVLVTMHRRENWGEPAERVCAAIETLVREHEDIEVLFSVHKNPAVRDTVVRSLGEVDRVSLLEPLDYLPFVKLMDAAYMILSDSGGMQEEAPSLGKPVLVLRETTERPEAIRAGTALLVGTSTENVVDAATRLLRDNAAYAEMSKAANPFGDGRAAAKIADLLAAALA